MWSCARSSRTRLTLELSAWAGLSAHAVENRVVARCARVLLYDFIYFLLLIRLFLVGRGRLERDQVVALLNERLAAADRFRSKIELSTNGQDAFFVPVLSPAAPAAAAVALSNAAPLAHAVAPLATAAVSAAASAASAAAPPAVSAARAGGWAALPRYDCAAHVKPLYVRTPTGADDPEAAYHGLCKFVAEVRKAREGGSARSFI